MRPIVLIGGGGHAVSVAAMIEDSATITGYTALEPAMYIDIPYLGTDEQALATLDPNSTLIHNAIGFTSGYSLVRRRKIIESYRGFRQATLTAPSAWIAGKAQIADGCAVMSRAIVNESSIGCMSVINTGAIIEHGCRIGENVFIGPGAIICGDVTIGNDTFIGAGAVLRQGIEIAAGVIIGMGAVVTQSILNPATYAGNPAKKIR